MKLLIANRGEIAVRIERAAAALGWQSVAVYVHEDAAAMHVHLADEAILLPGSGVQGYLDIDALIRAALQTGCQFIHPGYGFLSEDPAFAAACVAAGLGFVGPSPAVLELFGDKHRAHEWAREVGVPVLDATLAPTDLATARDFLANNPAGVMIKAVAGGGGRGMREVVDPQDLDSAYERCRSEARRSFGRDDVYVEALLPRAKHIEVQIIGDGSGSVIHIGERECSIQRQHQKLIEWAPSPILNDEQRAKLCAAAVRLTESIGYSGLATVEFLVDADSLQPDTLRYVFIEINPRLQVEHTVTEQAYAIDLVTAQLRIAAGESLTDLGLEQSSIAAPSAVAIQCRVNTETLGAHGRAIPATGIIGRFAPPTGADIRVDSHGEAGLVVDGGFDSLLAKVIVRAPSFALATVAAEQALNDFDIDGVATSLDLLRSVLTHPDFITGMATTAFLAEHPDLVDQAIATTTDTPTGDVQHLTAPLAGVVVAVDAEPGDAVSPRTTLVVLEAMKMEHPVTASAPGIVVSVEVAPGDNVLAGQLLVRLRSTGATADELIEADLDLDHIRPDLADIRTRHDATLDESRPEAVAKRHRSGHRTARENLADLCDPGSFIEYGALPVAAQRGRRNLDDLLAKTPADGLVTGLARINGASHDENTECVVLAYDYMVLAGTQGYFNHKKTDRMLRLAAQKSAPVVFFAEGGGGRPGDTDLANVMSSALDTSTFGLMGALSGSVPTVGILNGRCFAGNAALLGCCDVIIATADSTLGMAGPAMIEGGGLGTFAPEQIGPMSMQAPNGVIDILVDSDGAAVAAAKRYLSYFQGARTEWTQADQRALRHIIPANRLRVYDVRSVITGLADVDSVLELRRDFGIGAITALVRVEGRPMGLVANNPAHLGGAIDADAADKMARFLQLCDAHGLPVISLCDTPGFMVGPDAEQTATVRHFSRLFIIGSHLSVPVITVVLRKGYGLGAQAMAAGGFRETTATIAWPTGEIGPMGLEGAVRLGYSKELEAITDPDERTRRYAELVAEHYERGKAVNGAMMFELDDVIDPADTRAWITAAFAHHRTDRDSKPRRGYIDAW